MDREHFINSSTLIQKVWNFRHTLRDDGVGYGDHLEQLTYPLFLKLVHGCNAEQTDIFGSLFKQRCGRRKAMRT